MKYLTEATMVSNEWTFLAFATAVWMIFGAGMLFGTVTSTDGGGHYVVSSSDKLATHPTIVRAASVADSEEVAINPVIAGAVFVAPH
jgi:hypothetical protein